MDPKHRKIILDNLNELVEVTQNINDVIDILRSARVLNEYMVNHLNTYSELRKRTEEFYLMLLGRGPQAFDRLLVVLRGTKNSRAETLLLSSYKVDHYNLEAPSLCSAMDDVDLGKGDRKTKLVIDKRPKKVVVEKHPDNKFMDKIGEAYRMRSNPRGYALIINIYRTQGREDRRGSEKDVEKLSECFDQLGFEIIAKQDLTDDEIRAEVTKLKANPRLPKTDCLVVFLMGHGRQIAEREWSSVDILASNGQPINTNWLASEFQSVMKDRPKVFFFQACRTVEAENNSSQWNQPPVFINQANSTDKVTIEKWGDTVFGFSTVSGYHSMRDPNNGSWFITVLVEVFSELAWKLDLDALWREMDQRMKKKTSSMGHQTLELVKRALERKLYFNPHLYETDEKT